MGKALRVLFSLHRRLVPSTRNNFLHLLLLHNMTSPDSKEEAISRLQRRNATPSQLWRDYHFIMRFGDDLEKYEIERLVAVRPLPLSKGSVRTIIHCPLEGMEIEESLDVVHQQNTELTLTTSQESKRYLIYNMKIAYGPSGEPELVEIFVVPRNRFRRPA